MKRTMFKFEQLMHVNADRTKPEPFPGRYPTRWAFRFIPEKGSEVTYAGKPCLTVRNQMLKLVYAHPGWIQFSEWDKGGAIRICSSHTPAQYMRVTGLRARLLEQFYYPWSMLDGGDVLKAWRSPIYPKRILRRAYSFVIYSPFEKMDCPEYLEYVKGYKTWLGKNNVALWKS